MLGALRHSYDRLHESQFFIGLMILLANIGSRYIVLEFSKTQEQIFSGELMRKLFIFAAAFVATRDLIMAFVLTAVFTVLVQGLFNEKSKYCILPESFTNQATDEPSNAEVEKAKAVLAKHEESKNKAYTQSVQELGIQSSQSSSLSM